MVDRDRPVGPETRAERRVQLEVAEPVGADAAPLAVARLDVGADPLDEVVEVERSVARMDDDDARSVLR